MYSAFNVNSASLQVFNLSSWLSLKIKFGFRLRSVTTSQCPLLQCQAEIKQSNGGKSQMKENPRMCHWNALDPSSISPMTLTLLTEKIKETDLRHFCLFAAPCPCPIPCVTSPSPWQHCQHCPCQHCLHRNLRSLGATKRLSSASQGEEGQEDLLQS